MTLKEGNPNLRKGNIVFNYSDEEIREIKKCAKDIVYFANTYCTVKEACSKALGTGFKKGVFYKDIEVINIKSVTSIELKEVP